MYFSRIVRPIIVLFYFSDCYAFVEHMKISSTLGWLDLLVISSCNDMSLVSFFFFFSLKKPYLLIIGF